MAKSIVAVTNCPAGIAHTYMVAEAIQTKGTELGYEVHVETQGASGVENKLTPEQIKEGGFDAYFVDHTTGIYPQSSSGVPWSAATFQSKGDPITDLFEDMAAEATPL